ncbi:MAG: NfeD family protein [Maricaulaceae bacterium]|nr:NfeD family protein [Maricaulaceae bacterium]
MDVLTALLERLNIWVWWTLAGLVLIGELLTGTTYLLWPAAAALVTGMVALEMFGVPWPYQIGLFAVLSLGLLVVGDRYVRPRLKAGAASGLNERMNSLVGQSVTVVSGFAAGRGRVRLGDTEWSAESVDGSDLQAGAVARVTAVKDIVLVVAAG